MTERPRAPLAVKVIALIALIFLLERAREVVLPVAIAIILTFLLAPLVRVLRSRGAQRCARCRRGCLRPAFHSRTLGQPPGCAGQRVDCARTDVGAATDRFVRKVAQVDSLHGAAARSRFRPAVTTKGRPAAEVVPAQAPPASDPFKDKIAIEGIALTGSLIRQAHLGHGIDRRDDHFAVLFPRFGTLADGPHRRGDSEAPRSRGRARRLSRRAARYRALSRHAGDDQRRRRYCDDVGVDGDRVAKSRFCGASSLPCSVSFRT